MYCTLTQDSLLKNAVYNHFRHHQQSIAKGFNVIINVNSQLSQ